MEKKKLHIVKIGGNIIDDAKSLKEFIDDFSELNESCILVHGGGKTATDLCRRLGIETKLIDGRRITNADTLEIAVMVYAGLINKNIVALMQSKKINAIGLCGADANIITATKRAIKIIDYGFVGDIKPNSISTKTLQQLVESAITPVVSSITHDGNGQLLNTNADTIASVLAVSLSKIYEVHLYYCFDKNGVLQHVDDKNAVIEILDKKNYEELKNAGIISHGMIPKIDNAFDALNGGVTEVTIGNALELKMLISKNAGTRII